ncbi:GTPase Era [Buchnera aphidicola]|uniref:GTPase Era n=1 Tax=Buchnera aphidicola TaxID=9 RepID=UPI00094D17F4|nr:GTPase Era [Buchnera aphidicola]
MKKKTVFGKIIIVGRTNVGKSTLFNKFIKSKLSIVSHKVHTTQNHITGIYTLKNIQYELIDSPGLQCRYNNIDKKKLSNTFNLINETNIIIFLITSFIWTQQENKLLEYIQKQKIKYILAINKIDLVKNKKLLLPFLLKMNTLIPNKEIFLISAKKNVLVENLLNYINTLLPERAHKYPAYQKTTCTTKFLVEEIIRETLINLLNKELTYSFSISVINFYQDDKKKYTILGIVKTKNHRHKKIIIGSNGKKIQQCIDYSKIKIQKFLKNKIDLKIQVTIKKIHAH